jgi:hypothetical protein
MGAGKAMADAEYADIYFRWLRACNDCENGGHTRKAAYMDSAHVVLYWRRCLLASDRLLAPGQ